MAVHNAKELAVVARLARRQMTDAMGRGGARVMVELRLSRVGASCSAVLRLEAGPVVSKMAMKTNVMRIGGLGRGHATKQQSGRVYGASLRSREHCELGQTVAHTCCKLHLAD